MQTIFSSLERVPTQDLKNSFMLSGAGLVPSLVFHSSVGVLCSDWVGWHQMEVGLAVRDACEWC